MLMFTAACIPDENGKGKAAAEPVVLAYVISYISIIPNTDWVTNIDYGFGHVSPIR